MITRSPDDHPSASRVRRVRLRISLALLTVVVVLVIPVQNGGQPASATVAVECRRLAQAEAAVAYEQASITALRQTLEATSGGDVFIVGSDGSAPTTYVAEFAQLAKVSKQKALGLSALLYTQATQIVGYPPVDPNIEPVDPNIKPGGMFLIETPLATVVVRGLIDDGVLTAAEGGRLLVAMARGTGTTRAKVRRLLKFSTTFLPSLEKRVEAARKPCSATQTGCVTTAFRMAATCTPTTVTKGGRVPTVASTAPQRGYTLRTTVTGTVPAVFENHEVRISGSISNTSLSISSEMMPPADGTATITDTWSTPPATLQPGDVIELTCTVAATTRGKDAKIVSSSCGWDAAGAVKILAVTKAFAGTANDGKFYPSASGSLRIEVVPGGTGVTLTAFHSGANWGEGLKPPAIYTYAAT